MLANFMIGTDLLHTVVTESVWSVCLHGSATNILSVILACTLATWADVLHSLGIWRDWLKSFGWLQKLAEGQRQKICATCVLSTELCESVSMIGMMMGIDGYLS